jgi:hypothetical protein
MGEKRIDSGWNRRVNHHIFENCFVLSADSIFILIANEGILFLMPFVVFPLADAEH